MIYLQEKESGKKFSFSEKEIKELDRFIVDEAISSLGPRALDLCNDKYGHWKMLLKSGRMFHAYGTTEEYDSVLKVIIKNHHE